MAKKKPVRTIKAGKGKSRKTTPRHPLRGIVLGACLLVVLFFAAALIHYRIVQKRSEKTPGPAPVRTEARYKIPAFEIYPKEEIPPPKPIPKPAPTHLPRIAVIIDDLGYDDRMAEKFIRLGPVVTLSVLPKSPFQKRILRKAKNRGIETMLHLPMEPMEYPRVDPGPGALLTTMTPDERIGLLKAHLEAMPTIRGVNNHMGSKMTTLSNQMYQIFSILRQRDLYYIDSRTTPESLSRPSARLLKIPFAQRDVFLDHEQTAEFIARQIRQLVRIATRHGEAIGIGHPHEITFEILQKELSRLKNQVEWVPASAVVHIVG